MRIFHICEDTVWQAAKKAGRYEGDTLKTEGFIHCSTVEQVLDVANARFLGRAGLVLLEIDPAKLEPELRYENLEGGTRLFPHIYGPLGVNAVEHVWPFQPTPSGQFARGPWTEV